MAKYEKWLDPQGLTLLEGWARDGLSDEQIAHNCGITRQCLFIWKKKYPALAKALEKGREVVDYEVENALLKRALGYEYTEVTVESSGRDTKRRETVKQMAPDIGAQTFWLKCRRPDRWRDRPRDDGESAPGDCGVVVLAEVEEDNA